MALIWLEVDLYSNPEEKTREGQGRKNYGGCVQALFRFGIVQREVCFLFFFSQIYAYMLVRLCTHVCMDTKGGQKWASFLLELDLQA